MGIREYILIQVSYLRIGWHYVWWSRHVSQARYHDNKLESIVPRWRDK